jgi:hypothetical protein
MSRLGDSFLAWMVCFGCVRQCLGSTRTGKEKGKGRVRVGPLRPPTNLLISFHFKFDLLIYCVGMKCGIMDECLIGTA